MNRYRPLLVVSVLVLIGVAIFVFSRGTDRCAAAHRSCRERCESLADPTACQRDCDRALRECRGFVQVVDKPVQIACPQGPHGSAPCLKSLDEVCAMLGSCADCARTLCGDSRWTFVAQSPVGATLVANERVLASSTGSGNTATLVIPKSLQLGKGEQLSLRLETKSATVTMRRDG